MKVCKTGLGEYIVSMNETQPLKEIQPTSIKAYFGTTLGNLHKCLERKGGTIVFTKSKEEQHKFPDIQQFTTSPTSAADWAIIRAKRIGESPVEFSKELPVILEGELKQGTYTVNHELMPGESFPVATVYLPRDENVYWRGYDGERDTQGEKFHRFFTPRNPLDFISDESGNKINI